MSHIHHWFLQLAESLQLWYILLGVETSCLKNGQQTSQQKRHQSQIQEHFKNKQSILEDIKKMLSGMTQIE